MSAAERKRKSHENTFKKMTEEERGAFKEAEKKDNTKSCSNSLIKKERQHDS